MGWLTETNHATVIPFFKEGTQGDLLLLFFPLWETHLEGRDSSLPSPLTTCQSFHQGKRWVVI